MKKVFADGVLQFNDTLAQISIDLTDNFRLVNPFRGEFSEEIKKITKEFYFKYYNDKNKRIMILGSSPARRGTAITGVPFEDAQHLLEQTGIAIKGFNINKASSNFLYDVIEKYGGSKEFYSNFYLNFVCPLGIVRVNDKGHEVNCNYYENKYLMQSLNDFILKMITKQLELLNIDTSVCYCIGSGANFEYLKLLNEKYHFFGDIIPLEHPRFIMQYNSKDKEKFMNKYLQAFNYKK